MNIKIWNDKYSIESLKDKDAFKVLSLISSILGSLNCIYWVSSGTALGIYRDKRFIYDDTDIDLDIIGNKDIEDIKLLCGDYFKLIRTTTDVNDGFVYQLAYLHQETNIIVDLIFFRGETENLYSYQEYSKKFTYPFSFLTQIVYHEFNNVFFPFINPELYLKYVYGKKWKTPLNKNEFKYNWGQEK
jgi:hypothetical protein